MNKLILVMTMCALGGCIEPNKLNPHKDSEGKEPVVWVSCQGYSHAALEYTESTADRIPVVAFKYNLNGLRVVNGKCVGNYLLREM